MPSPMSPMLPGLSPAATDLGLGSMLKEQVANETDEQRRKRMQMQQQRMQMGSASNMLGLGGTGILGGGLGG